MKSLRQLVATPALWPLAALIVIALLGPGLAPYDPLATDVAHALSPPSFAHWFGTDQLGRDILSRVLAAGRLDLAIAFAAVALSAVVGVTIGALAGYLGGALDQILGRLTDVLMAFPLFIVAMALVAALGMVFSYMLGANVLVEKLFAWPGISAYAVDALMAADYAPVQGFVLTVAILFTLVNLGVDILHGLVDPRVLRGA